MRNGLHALTQREKETLRLLVGGHDAKSIARHLGLSVHTVNERLRDARRKLGATSSREAARFLAEAERSDPNSLADKEFGVPESVAGVRSDDQADRRPSTAHRLAWFGGGMLIMSLVIATVMLSSAFHGSGQSNALGRSTSALAGTASSTAKSEGFSSARDWIALIDGQRWEESWRTAAALFKSQLSAPQWASMIQSVRQPLGPVSARSLQSVTKTSSLPGAPAGEYEILQFQTSFANNGAATETVVLTRDRAGWKVAGYFIR